MEENSQRDDDDADELADNPLGDLTGPGEENLEPLGVQRSQSQRLGIQPSFPRAPMSMKKTESNKLATPGKEDRK